MSNLLSFVLLIQIIIWSVFQPALFTNAQLVEQALSSVVYQAQKEASLQGRYDDDIYNDIKDKLVEVHKFDPTKIEITGTETLTTRGNRITIEITIPKPQTEVFSALSTSTETFTYKKSIMSEYVD